MAIFYFRIHIISRGKGGSAISAAAYRACQELYNPYDGRISDYTHKAGNVYSQIFIPDNTPNYLLNREKLWGSLEEAEKNKRAQLCREVTVALPKELNLKEQIELVKAYVTENFLPKGMVCDINIHDKGDGNPHAHILLPMRWIYVNTLDNNLGFLFFTYYLDIQNISYPRFLPVSKSYNKPKQLYTFAQTPLESYS